MRMLELVRPQCRKVFPARLSYLMSQKDEFLAFSPSVAQVRRLCLAVCMPPVRAGTRTKNRCKIDVMCVSAYLQASHPRIGHGIHKLCFPTLHLNSTLPGPGRTMGDHAVVDAAPDEKSPIPSRASPTLEDDKEVGIVQLSKLESEPVVEAVLEPTPRMKCDAIFQFITLCFSIFVPGFNDGTLGPLLPRIQAVYHGSIVGSCTFLYLTHRFGFGLVVVVASICMVFAYSLEAAAVPFPVFVFGYFFNGYGSAHLNAGTNAFLASLSVGTASTRMGILHASYGLGAMASPLLSTQFAQLPRWSFMYLILLGLSLAAALLQSIVFRFRTQEQCWQDIGQPPSPQDSDGILARYKKVFRLRAVHLMALFAFTYVGHEVTAGSWIVTYVINQRHGGPSSGYTSSGFYGGLMLGRIALLPVSKWIGERRVVFVYIIAVVALELVVWLVPNLFAGAISISFVGFFLGPIFPILMNHAGRVLPPDCISGAIGWVGSWGAAGAAVFPFITGAIASKAGIGSLLPVLVVMASVLFIVWACVPATRQQLA
ncbi:major facilitator superfamily domain-containing protein [Ganoderma leucocontextum]|nr:major facilitator superfamily domain-containing protein [Ganoderma leucocontextum]